MNHLMFAFIVLNLFVIVVSPNAIAYAGVFFCALALYAATIRRA